MLSEAVLVIFFSGAVNGALYYALYNQIRGEFRQIRSQLGAGRSDFPERVSFDITNSAQLDYFGPDLHHRSVSPSQGIIGRELLSADSEVARAVVEAIHCDIGLYVPDKEPSFKEPSCKEPSSKEPSFKEPSFKEPSFKEPSSTEPSFKEPSSTEPSSTEPSRETPGGSAEEPVQAEADGIELLCTSPGLDDTDYTNTGSTEDLSSSCGSAPAASFVGVGNWLWKRDTKASLGEERLADKDSDWAA